MRLYEPPVLPRLLLLLHATPLRWDRDAEEEDRKKEEMDAMATPYQYGTHQPPKQVVRPKGKLFCISSLVGCFVICLKYSFHITMCIFLVEIAYSNALAAKSSQDGFF